MKYFSLCLAYSEPVSWNAHRITMLMARTVAPATDIETNLDLRSRSSHPRARWWGWGVLAPESGEFGFLELPLTGSNAKFRYRTTGQPMD